jgi:hypothetical protein
LADADLERAPTVCVEKRAEHRIIREGLKMADSSSNEPSSSEDEPEFVSPEQVSTLGWRSGAPVQIDDSISPSDLRLNRCNQLFSKLTRKLEERPTYVNDEMKEEFDITKQVTISLYIHVYFFGGDVVVCFKVSL